MLSRALMHPVCQGTASMVPGESVFQDISFAKYWLVHSMGHCNNPHEVGVLWLVCNDKSGGRRGFWRHRGMYGGSDGSRRVDVRYWPRAQQACGFDYALQHRIHAMNIVASKIIDGGICRGVDTCDQRKTRATTGFSRLIYNRMGMRGTGRLPLALSPECMKSS